MSVMGLKEITVQLEKHKKATAQGVRVGMRRAGLLLQRESMLIVPVDKNFLRSSALEVTRMEGEGWESEMTVGYGTDYAVYVHENLEARHKPGTSAKYLEKPLREKRDLMAKIVVEAIREFQE